MLIFKKNYKKNNKKYLSDSLYLLYSPESEKTRILITLAIFKINEFFFTFGYLVDHSTKLNEFDNF